MVGFDKPTSFPHFNKREETAAEFTRDYKASIRDEGPARGFSTKLPHSMVFYNLIIKRKQVLGLVKRRLAGIFTCL
jgi:hypothetical protein